ncbi:two-component sensor histidine kinase [Dactylosporangium aurantiacum]|uniref:Two-component sensor histidine kinase n=1 Tax=Dactylosporangium aurantiacum TaxID=35754 RepID=A0A9Q9IHH3_9ACTN|nr:histidine kinase [Dactylosporangium aurantiacum]MDG6102207.1 histidine kinase [Dactylosporangium aurantiacum]UWZ53479.1 two-component sensor histidine kinase [Dactylosporangium aurantiacum]
MATRPADRRLRRARHVALAALATGVAGSLLAPGWVVLRGGHQVPLALAGVLAFAAAHAAALHAALTPWLPETTRTRRLLWYAAAAALSVPLVGATAGPRAWAWIGATVVGTAPLLGHRGAALLAALAPPLVAAGLGGWRHDVAWPVLLTAAVGAAVALVNRLQLWFWDLLLDLDQGRTAQASLAAAEERLRFARDVHDLLGHSLTVIALKAELAARLAAVDAGRAAQEAAEAQRLAAGALTDVRAAVHGYRDSVDLTAQLDDVRRLLDSCGVRCTVTARGTVPPAPAAQLAAVLREAVTNLLRHSSATWCTIDVAAGPPGTTLTITNDGAGARTQDGADPHGHGLRGLAERLAEAGGTITHRVDGDRFELRATA